MIIAPLKFQTTGCSINNAAERSLRCVALGSAKLNGIDPQAWLADVIARISDMPVSRLHELLPWEWNAATPQVKAA